MGGSEYQRVCWRFVGRSWSGEFAKGNLKKRRKKKWELDCILDHDTSKK